MRAHLAVLAFVVVLALVSSSSPACAAVSESRASHEASAALGDVFEDRANLFFRTMDADGDNHLSAADAAAPSAAAALAAHLPGVSAEDFAAFVEVADSDGDHRLSRDELKSALLAGAPEASEAAAEAADDEVLVETSATATTEVKAEVARRASMRRGRRGFFSTIKKGVKDIGSAIGETIKAKIVDFGEKVLGRVDKSQDGCVMCQYLVERMESNVRQAAVFPSFAAGPQVASALSGDAMPGAVRQAAARTAAAAGVSPAPAAAVSSFLELAAEQTPMEVAAAGMIATTRAATRYQRTMERQKYNEIYRIVDLTLDDVCEQGMPNAFYGYCKQIYNVQPDVVDGLRYQYRPSDICFRIGMCSRASYIARGMHSRYIETA